MDEQGEGCAQHIRRSQLPFGSKNISDVGRKRPVLVAPRESQLPFGSKNISDDEAKDKVFGVGECLNCLSAQRTFRIERLDLKEIRELLEVSIAFRLKEHFG